MELYSGPKMAHGKYEKTNVARLIVRDSTVFISCFLHKRPTSDGEIIFATCRALYGWKA
jgi:hypothetical protein